MSVNKVILIRHGQSKWNLLNKFTGWNDVELSELGKKEAVKAANLLKINKIDFNYSFTSMLTRSIHTLWIILKTLNKNWVTVNKDWRLNERHYGALQGLNKDETIKKYGKKKVHEWRRSYKISPPKIKNASCLFSGYDERYENIGLNNFPKGESLELTEKRVVKFWKETLLPKMKLQKKIIIVAHGNSLRALIKYLGKIDDALISRLDIPTGSPIIYEFNKNNVPVRYYFL
ncbi:2,3-bisphosphoglycerate-dependent phosphoglycerate mutase [Buchnera aphidicola (Anoecia corni)]|uniref:2,3-bisphosphoglycerate-dependent phosphoglycerate mutase n=1 Tax=Buchnera aphidicola (Anoecia corni) TaxID=2994477 RepID=A0AAT9IGW2_9GAMM